MSIIIIGEPNEATGTSENLNASAAMMSVEVVPSDAAQTPGETLGAKVEAVVLPAEIATAAASLDEVMIR